VSDVEALRALMEADRWIDRVRHQRERLPESAELATVESQLRELVAALAQARAALTPVREAYDAAQAESERLRHRAGELASALESSTAHARDLAAMQTEVTHVRERLSEAEDRELDLLLALEPLDAAVAEVRLTAQPAIERREALRLAIVELQATLDEEAAALSRDRAALADNVEPALRARYEDALARAGTSGASQVIEGRCDGCRIQLSPLDFDRFKGLAAGTLMSCPSCGRLLLP
jgi:uncharacterized protein